MRTRSLLMVLAVGLVATGSRRAAAQPTAADEVLEQARMHYEQGQAAYDAGRHDEATAQWEKSYQLAARPLLLFNLGQSTRKGGDCARALTYYRRFLLADPNASNRPEAEAFVVEMGACVERARVERPTTPTTAPSEPEAKPVEDAPVVEERRVGRPGKTKRWVGLTLMFVGAGLAATGVYFGTEASAAADDVTSKCQRAAGGCEWSELSSREADGERAELLQWVMYGAGGAALVSGAVMYYLGVRERSGATQVAIAPRGDGALIRVAAAF